MIDLFLFVFCKLSCVFIVNLLFTLYIAILISYQVSGNMSPYFCLDLLESYRDCIPVFRLWSNSEIKLGDSLNEIADAMEKNNEALKSLVTYCFFKINAKYIQFWHVV